MQTPPPPSFWGHGQSYQTLLFGSNGPPAALYPPEATSQPLVLPQVTAFATTRETPL